MWKKSLKLSHVIFETDPMQLFYNFCYYRSSFWASQSYLLLPVITIIYFAKQIQNNKIGFQLIKVLNDEVQSHSFTIELYQYYHTSLHCKIHNHPTFKKRLSPCAETPNLQGNNFRQAWKLQTFWEMTFAMRGNTKSFGKRLSPCAEMPNHSGNNFRHARKCQTIRETTFAMRGNSKLFGKLFAGGPQAQNLLKSDLREARKRQNL